MRGFLLKSYIPTFTFTYVTASTLTTTTTWMSNTVGDPAFIRDLASIKTSVSDPRLVLETQLQYETRLVLAVLQYLSTDLLILKTSAVYTDLACFRMFLMELKKFQFMF